MNTKVGTISPATIPMDLAGEQTAWNTDGKLAQMSPTPSSYMNMIAKADASGDINIPAQAAIPGNMWVTTKTALTAPCPFQSILNKWDQNMDVCVAWL